MLRPSKKFVGLFTESEMALSAKFAEAGLGFDTGGARLFHPLEAAYLLKLNLAQVQSAPTLEKFISSQKKSDKLFPFAFAAYSIIRLTGRLVRLYAEETRHFRVYAPGVGREQERPSQLVALLPGAAPSPLSIAKEVKVAHRSRLDLVIATGTEKEIKFYKVSSFNY